MTSNTPSWRAELQEAAKHAAAEAPEIRPGDDVALGLQRLYVDLPAQLAQHRAAPVAGEEPGHAA